MIGSFADSVLALIRLCWPVIGHWSFAPVGMVRRSFDVCVRRGGLFVLDGPAKVKAVSWGMPRRPATTAAQRVRTGVRLTWRGIPRAKRASRGRARGRQRRRHESPQSTRVSPDLQPDDLAPRVAARARRRRPELRRFHLGCKLVTEGSASLQGG
jgi:hypothetical protein